MSSEPQWTPAAVALASSVCTAATEWWTAVAQTPRHALVTRWWERIPRSTDLQWSLSAPVGAGLIEAAYSNRTLVTRVGCEHTDQATQDQRPCGEATSSSTLPGLLVTLFHWLEPRSGDRVLDVGTGTGYGAGLLTRRLGDEQVVSIDVDPYLTGTATPSGSGWPTAQGRDR